MIGLIGSLCIDRESASGQAVRTTILYNALIDRYGVDEVYCVNTHGFRKRPIQVLLESIKCSFKCNDIIIMVHENGRKLYFPYMALLARYFNKNIFHNVIGGNFPDYLQNNKWLIKYVKQFKVNWVQMNSQIQELKRLGIYNCELLPNTKNNSIVENDEIKEYSDSIYKFCTFSRISKEKGIEQAIKAIEAINDESNNTIVTLDIYGIPDDDYKIEFLNTLSACSSAVSYMGFVDNKNTVNTLRNYYMLLFPSTYKGEGFPGTIWDAFAAGLPPIVTDWHYNAEIVEDGLTGFVYDYTDKEALINTINYAITNKEHVDSMRVNCLNEIQKYLPDKVFPIIFKYFD